MASWRVVAPGGNGTGELAVAPTPGVPALPVLLGSSDTKVAPSAVACCTEKGLPEAEAAKTAWVTAASRWLPGEDDDGPCNWSRILEVCCWATSGETRPLST